SSSVVRHGWATLRIPTDRPAAVATLRPSASARPAIAAVPAAVASVARPGRAAAQRDSALSQAVDRLRLLRTEPLLVREPAPVARRCLNSICARVLLGLRPALLSRVPPRRIVARRK